MGTCNEVHIAYVQYNIEWWNFLFKGVKMLDCFVTIIVNNLSLKISYNYPFDPIKHQLVGTFLLHSFWILIQMSLYDNLTITAYHPSINWYSSMMPQQCLLSDGWWMYILVYKTIARCSQLVRPGLTSALCN